jgi:hypothetical protein
MSYAQYFISNGPRLLSALCRHSLAPGRRTPCHPSETRTAEGYFGSACDVPIGKGRSFKIPENNSRIGNPSKFFSGLDIRFKTKALIRLRFFDAKI